MTQALDALGVPDKQSQRLVADRGYDSNAFLDELVKRGIKPIIPARSTNEKETNQDGRKRRCYQHHWIIERTFAWLGHFRRLVVRYERLDRIYAVFFHLACAFFDAQKVLKQTLGNPSCSLAKKRNNYWHQRKLFDDDEPITANAFMIYYRYKRWGHNIYYPPGDGPMFDMRQHCLATPVAI